MPFFTLYEPVRDHYIGGQCHQCLIGADSDISDKKKDCDKALKWKGGTFDDPTAPGVKHSKGQTGVVEWDVTADVLAGADNGWILFREKDKKKGEVRYYSKEGAAAIGDLGKAPKLILEFAGP